jgi:hypothetical protein
LDDAVDRLVTCWDKVSTFDTYAVAPNPQVKSMVTNLNPACPVFVVAFSRDVLNRLWGEEYPTPGNNLVVMDGNHRLHAFAIRRRIYREAACPLSISPFLNPRAIGIFVGY